jgi:hypothetical protein
VCVSTLCANLNPTFALNVGPDDIAVLPEGQLNLSSAFTGPTLGPKDFDIVISFTNPFVYNPLKGNLLLDARIFSGASSTFFDATDMVDTSDGMSRRWSIDGVDSVSSIYSDSLGLITKFTSTAVPEPCSLTLLALGALMLVARKFV